MSFGESAEDEMEVRETAITMTTGYTKVNVEWEDKVIRWWYFLVQTAGHIRNRGI